MLRIEPRTARGEELIPPLCYADPDSDILLIRIMHCTHVVRLTCSYEKVSSRTLLLKSYLFWSLQDVTAVESAVLETLKQSVCGSNINQD